MKNATEQYFEELIERHLPVAFLDYEALNRMKQLLFNRNNMGRKEVLIVAYLVGATVDESNHLLSLMGHAPLYVKRREDAIWKFMLKSRMDSASVIDEIFLQNVDEKGGET